MIPSSNKNKLDKTQIEHVQKKKHEYYLLGSFLIKRGLTLFSYNPLTNNVEVVEVKHSGNEVLSLDSSGNFNSYDPDSSIKVDSRSVYFQALNMTSAKNRVKKWKQGKLELFNLQKPKNKSMFEL